MMAVNVETMGGDASSPAPRVLQSTTPGGVPQRPVFPFPQERAMCINPPVPTGRFSLNPAASAADADAAALPGAPPHWRQQVQRFIAAAHRSQDAITLAQAAEQAMARVQAHLARMHALAVEASNSDVAAPERSKAQQEINQRVADIDRIARTTAVAGQPLLDGAVHCLLEPVGAIGAVAAQAGGAALACLPNLRAQSLSDLRYAAHCWRLDGAAPTALPAATGLTLAVGDQPPVALGELPAATSAAQRLAQLCQVINDQTAKTGVAAFVQPVQPLPPVPGAKGEQGAAAADGAVQLQLLSRRMGAQGQALPVQLGGVVQAMPPVRGDGSAACAAAGWTVHAVCPAQHQPGQPGQRLGRAAAAGTSRRPAAQRAGALCRLQPAGPPGCERIGIECRAAAQPAGASGARCRRRHPSQPAAPARAAAAQRLKAEKPGWTAPGRMKGWAKTGPSMAWVVSRFLAGAYGALS